MPYPSTTAFICIPGGFCPSTFYDKLLPLLHSQGYPATAVDNPSCGRKEGRPAATGYDDAANVREKVQEYADQGMDVILVANSYGGFVALEATKGVAKTDREKEGKKGGVVHIMMLASRLCPLGMSVHEMLLDADIMVKTQVGEDEDPYIPVLPIEALGDMPNPLFQSLDKEEQMKYALQCREQSALAFSVPLTYAAYEFVPTTVVIGSKDGVLDIGFQHRTYEEIAAQGVKGLRKVVLDADHCMMLSQPEETARLCFEVAESL